MKKIFLLLTSVIFAYYSFGQTDSQGLRCSEAAFLDHSQNVSQSILRDNADEHWYKFIANTSYMSFIALDFIDVEISLYKGTSTSLIFIKKELSSQIIKNELIIGQTYYIKIDGHSVVNSTTGILYNYYAPDPSPEDVCESSEDNCNLIVNGNFEMSESSINSFRDGNVYGWTYLMRTPQIKGNSNKCVQMWAMHHTNGNDYAESIISCTNLIQNKIYLLLFDYTKRDFQNTNENLDIFVNIAKSENIDNMQGQSSTPDFSNISQNICAINNASESVDFLHNFQLFKPNFNANRLFIYSKATSLNVPIFCNIDNVQIVPIEYRDTITCLEEITLQPTCLNGITDVLNNPNINFSWSSNQTGAIISGGNTLTPTVDATLNPYLTLDIEQNGEHYYTSVAVYHQEMQVEYAITNNSCGENANGAIDLTVIGGTPNYTYQWYVGNTSYQTLTGNATTGGDLINLESAVYTLYLSSSEGCSAVVYKIEVHNTPMTVDAQGGYTFPSQDCGGVHANVSNGTPPYTYQWENSNGQIVGTTASVGGLGVGEYTVTVTEQGGCQATASCNIYSASIGLADDEDIYICEGGSVTLTISDVYDEYIWNTEVSANEITLHHIGLEGGDVYGDYTCNYNNEEGCRLQKTFHILPPVLNIDVDALGSCDYISIGEKGVYVTATSGFSNYQWSYDMYNYNNEIIYTGTLSGITGYIVHDNASDVERIEVTVTAQTPAPSSCHVTATATVYLGQSITSNTLLTEDWIDKNLFVFTNILLNDHHSHLIKDCHIEFAPSYGIEIYGKETSLEIIHSEITGLYCADELWKGIYLKGNYLSEHTNAFQPSVIVNKSTISGADYAIGSYAGGIVKTEYSNYINNNKAICLHDYNLYEALANDISKCRFETNTESNLITNFNFEEFISVDNLMTFNTRGNHFANLHTEKPYHLRGTAIRTNNTKSVRIVYSNTFERMTKAIDIQKTEHLDISYNQLKDNYRGISVVDAFVPNITRNRFNDEYLMPYNHAFQLMARACKEPNIAQNNFKNGVVGVHLSKYNDGSFQVYNNTFRGFSLYSNATLNGHPTAILNAADNGTFGNTSTGAEFKCNTFEDYDYAIAIMDGKVKGEQGTNLQNTKAPAGNRFYDDNNLTDGNFFISQIAQNLMGNNYYKYYQHSSQICDLGDIYRYTEPNNYGIKGIKKMPSNENFTSSSCPVQEYLPMSVNAFEQKQEQIALSQSVINTQEDSLQAKIDQGNTDLLLSDIQLANDANFTELVQNIETIDSYLSDETAIEFIQKPTERQVAKAVGLIANSPLPHNAKVALEQMDMDEDLKAYVYAHQKGLSKREQSERAIHELKLQKQRYINEAIRMAYTEDSSSTNSANCYQSVVDLLLSQNNWQSQERAYRMLKNKQQETEADEAFNNLQAMLNNFEDEYRYHLEDYLQMLQLEAGLDTLNDSLSTIAIVNQQSLLERIKNGCYTEGRASATLLLQDAKLLPKEPIFIQLPNPEIAANNRTLNNSAPKKQNFLHFKGLPDRLEVYPNPVKNRLTVEYIMFNGQVAKQLGIYDLNGKLLQTQPINKPMGVLEINVSHLQSGTYLIAFGVDGTNASASKFIKQ